MLEISRDAVPKAYKTSAIGGTEEVLIEMFC